MEAGLLLGKNPGFFIPNKKKFGLSKVILSFLGKKLDDNKIHDIVVKGNINPTSNLLINTGYVFYN